MILNRQLVYGVNAQGLVNGGVSDCVLHEIFARAWANVINEIITYHLDELRDSKQTEFIEELLSSIEKLKERRLF